MKRFVRLPIVLIITLLIFSASCREAEETATPPAPTATHTAVPQPTDTPEPSLIDGSAPLHPRLVGQHPAAGEEAPLDGIFELYFDQPMHPETAVSVLDDGGEEVEGELSWPQPRVLRFKPTSTFKPASHYQVVVEDTAVSAEGVPLLDGLTLDFYTIGDLAVSQISPDDGLVDVAIDSAITVIFNRPVVPLLVGEDAANLPNPLTIEPAIPGQGEWVNTSVYIYRPEGALIGRQTYTVNVNADVINEMSATGAQMTADFSSTFTAAPPTFNRLELVDVSWNPHSSWQDLPLDQAYRLHFNQGMDVASTETAVSLAPRDSNEPVPLEIAWDDAFTTMTITPTELLKLETTYILRIDDSAQSEHGGTLAEPFTWNATTVRYPAILNTDPANGSHDPSYYDSAFSIYFDSPMSLNSLKGKVRITPEIWGDLDGLYNEWDWSYNFYGFKPSTTYTVEILPGMADLYGNEISEGRTIQFTTAALSPNSSLNLPYSVALYRTGGSESLWVSHQNVSALNVDLYEVDLRTFGRLLHGQQSGVRYEPGEGQRVWQKSTGVDTPENVLDYKRFLVNNEDGTQLPTGYYFVTLDAPELRHNEPHWQTQVLVKSSANVVLKTTTTEAMVWVTDLESGAPLPNVPITLYDESFNPVFEAVTDSDGLIYRDNLQLKPGWDGRYYAVAGNPADDIFGLAISNWNEGISPRDFGIYTDYYLQPNEPTVYIYTDRPIYRPGQPVYFKGIVRLNDDLQYSLPEFEAVQVEISSFDETIYTQKMPLSDYGSFSGEITLDDEAVLGGYWISVRHGDRVIGNGYFDVAEYRKPTFQVEVTAEETAVANGDTVNLTVDASFFSGGAVAGGQVDWWVRSEGYTFRGEGNLSRFSFRDADRDRGYYYYDRSYVPSEVIVEGSDQTDGQGQFHLQVPAELDENSSSRTFVFEASVTDIAGNQVSGRSNVIVHQGRVYAGVAPQSAVGEAEKPLGFDVVAVDWDSEPVPGQIVNVEVVERRWYSVQEEDDRGRTIWSTSVEEIPIEVEGDGEVVTDGDGRTSFSFIPPNGGVYKATVTTQDAEGNSSKASTFVWVSGSEYVSWRRVNDHSFELISDKTSYEPGETAEILIASPFQGEVSALVTVERGHIKQQELIRLTSNSTIYRLPITGDMAPNIFVSVLIVKGVDETNLAPNFKLGMAQFTVNREEQELNVEITPDKTAVSPEDTVTYNLQVTDHAGQPVQAELSLSLTDLAVLTLANRKEARLLDHFYSEQYLSVNTATLLAHNMDAYNEELEDEIKGGGGGAGTYGILRIREDFPDTTYWSGHTMTDLDGSATISVTLPDNLTTWRLDARAVTLDTKVGQATNDIVSTLPLLVSPQTTRFFIVGDVVELGTAVHNNTDAEMSARVSLAADGVILNDPSEQTVTIPPQQQAYVTWQAAVLDVERVDLVFSAEAGAFSDASRPPLATLENGGIPVYKYEVPETVGTSGQLLEPGAVVESIALPIYPDYELTQGTVTVQVAPSLAAAMTDGLDYLEHYEYECTEQIISKFLPNLLTTRALNAAGIEDADLQANLDAQVNIALQRLYSRQLPDGGWSWWDGPRSSTLVSAYVVLALQEAHDSGYAISDDVLQDGIRYLQNNLHDVDQMSGRYKYNRQAFLIYVLARVGEANNQQMNSLYDKRSTLDLYARGYLAQALYHSDAEDPRLEVLASDFISHAILSATGAHWEEKERDYYNWNSDTRTTAIILDTMVKLDPENPLVANAVRWLMAHRTNGRWASTQETAWTLIALTDFMVASGELEANYEYEVALNGVSKMRGTANADTLRETEQLQIDISELFKDELNRLAFGRSEGAGNLYYTTHLEAYLPVEQVQPLDRGIILSRRYVDADDRETAITEIEQGETFLARLTIVVPNSLHYAVIEDYLPAGVEAIDQSLKTSQQVGAPERYDWDEYGSNGYGWWYFDHVELRDEKVVISADYLPAGTYEYVYLVRAAVVGEYRVIPPTAQEFYFPEVYGRGAGSVFAVLPKD